MTDVDLRSKIRELMTSGVLPKESAPITRPGPTHTPGTRRSKTGVGGPHQEPCAICGEPGPQVQHFYIAGQVVRVHASCNALWKLEQTRGFVTSLDYQGAEWCPRGHRAGSGHAADDAVWKQERVPR